MSSNTRTVHRPKSIVSSVAAQLQAKFQQATALHQSGQLQVARQLYEEILKKQPKHFDALHFLGAIALQEKDHTKALALIDRAIQIHPTNARFFYHRGLCFQELKQYEAAVESYDRAIAMQSNFSEAYSNRGAALRELRRFDAALASYDHSLAIKPDAAHDHSNRGAVLQELNQLDLALESLRLAITLNPYDARAHHRLGLALKDANQIEAAAESYENALRIEPDCEYSFGTWLDTKMHLCRWHGIEEDILELRQKLSESKKVAHSFHVLALCDSLAVQRRAAEIWVADKHPANDSLGMIARRAVSKKIRLAYFSADFHNHATTCLMAELFEMHDRNRFELIAFSFGPDQRDDMFKRVFAAFDQFHDVRNMDDKNIARLARTLAIDIAVDLKGYTRDSRVGIFSYRAAPIQVSYLGYPGTMGASYIDYVIADKTLIPEKSRSCYSEKIVYLPHSYQVNDSKRQISDQRVERQTCGLPEAAFVFCCFNHQYKIGPATFGSWMRILAQVPGGVLWLLIDNPTAQANLRNEARERGIDPARLVFARRLPLAQHLARHRAADLFLDTLPCNAHTTTSDALWAGLPVLTLRGESFASRVAASLLTAIDLPELIADTQETYEALAVELAQNPQRLQAIQIKLEANRLTAPLFNTQLFTQHIETAYAQMMANYCAGLKPEHIYVES